MRRLMTAEALANLKRYKEFPFVIKIIGKWCDEFWMSESQNEKKIRIQWKILHELLKIRLSFAFEK